jgi:hypothetical protein
VLDVRICGSGRSSGIPLCIDRIDERASTLEGHCVPQIVDGDIVVELDGWMALGPSQQTGGSPEMPTTLPERRKLPKIVVWARDLEITVLLAAFWFMTRHSPERRRNFMRH